LGHNERRSVLEGRWFWVSEHLQANFAAVFLGEQAVEAMEIPWPEECTHWSPERPSSDGGVLLETAKLYVPSVSVNEPSWMSVVLDLTVPDHLITQQGATPSWYEWQFRRADARVVCCRASECALFGFGRPHPTKPSFKVHPDFAGPLRDYCPGMAGIPDEWKGFEPVFMKVEPAENPKDVYHVKIYPVWEDQEVELIVEENPDDVPEMLKEYEFGRKKKVNQKRF
jgi:hypothetical protein